MTHPDNTGVRREASRKISIVTPSLNQGAFIEQTIRSVLDQNYPNLEYIVIDGGSRDNSVEIIRRYQDRLAFWSSEPDSGQSNAINKGLRLATGEVAAYLNSDDQLLPGSLAIVAERMADPMVPWLAGGCVFSDPAGNKLSEWLPTPPPLEHHPVQAVVYPWGVPQPACFWRRDLFEQNGYFREDLHYLMDTEFQVRLVLAGELPELVPQLLANAIIHPASKTGASHGAFWQEEHKLLGMLGYLLTPEERTIGRALRSLIEVTNRHDPEGASVSPKEWLPAFVAAPRVIGRASVAAGLRWLGLRESRARR